MNADYMRMSCIDLISEQEKGWRERVLCSIMQIESDVSRVLGKKNKFVTSHWISFYSFKTVASF